MDYKVNTILTLEDAYNILSKWVPSIINHNDNFNDISSVITILIHKYIELLLPYQDILGMKTNNLREPNCLASGFIFFYGCMLYIMHFPDWGNYIYDIFLYNLLYLLVDNYLDDNRIDIKDKELAINQMEELIQDPLLYKKMLLANPVLETIAITYHKLIQKHPKCKDTLIKLFKMEVKSVQIQKDSFHHHNTYYNLAIAKGGYTIEVLSHMIPDAQILNKESYHIGTIMQLIDDSLDVIEDKNNGINTIATYHINIYGTLDLLWIDIIEKINRIDMGFPIFNIIYSLFVIYLPISLLECYSSEVKNYVNKINLFYNRDGITALNERIMNEYIKTKS
jgi:hypothetical protein